LALVSEEEPKVEDHDEYEMENMYFPKRWSW
jgi:hypothetical protein